MYDGAEHRIEACFPRCYDLSDDSQIKDFMKNFNQTAILSLIKLAASNFLAESSCQNSIQSLVQEFSEKKKLYTCSKVFKSYFKHKCSKLDSHRKDCKPNSKVRMAYRFGRDLLSQTSQKTSNKRPIRNKNGIPPGEEQNLVDFHTAIISKPAGIKQLLTEETYIKVKLVMLQQKLSRKMVQFRDIDGTSNVWIVKPSYNARGIGIYCTR